jgi:hypothetical protein
MRALHAAVIASALCSALGCASSGGSAASTGGSAAQLRGNSNVITSEEITAGAGSTAYEVIQRLRPNYLRTRGAVRGAPTASGNNLEPIDIVVYVNESRVGGSDQLRQISVHDIREIRYFSANEATTKWGTGHSAGAIQVLSH